MANMLSLDKQAIIKKLESTDNPNAPRRHVTVRHSHPIESARQAVQAAIVQEFRNAESAS